MNVREVSAEVNVKECGIGVLAGL